MIKKSCILASIFLYSLMLTACNKTAPQEAQDNLKNQLTQYRNIEITTWRAANKFACAEIQGTDNSGKKEIVTYSMVKVKNSPWDILTKYEDTPKASSIKYCSDVIDRLVKYRIDDWDNLTKEDAKLHEKTWRLGVYVEYELH